MYKIGLTGGIASGKSTVSEWLAQKGAPIIDADVVAREVVEPGTAGLAELVAHFGPSILQGDGTLDRPKLGAIIFNNEEKRRELNQILHRYIHERIEELASEFAKAGHEAAIYDIPLLIETNWYKDMDEVWLVSLEPDVQKDRLMARNGFTEAEAKARIASQMPLADKKAYSHVIIDNNGTLEDLMTQLADLWQAKGHLFAKEDS